MLDTRSVRDFWGRKWNLQVTTTLKRFHCRGLLLNNFFQPNDRILKGS